MPAIWIGNRVLTFPTFLLVFENALVTYAFPHGPAILLFTEREAAQAAIDRLEITPAILEVQEAAHLAQELADVDCRWVGLDAGDGQELVSYSRELLVGLLLGDTPGPGNSGTSPPS